MSEFDDGVNFGGWIAMCATLFLIGIVCMLLFAGDGGDVVSVRALGEKMCGSYGLNYSHRVMDGFVPVIYCTNLTAQQEHDKQSQILDGILKIDIHNGEK